jgi:F0F1-type ATP synthase assembly protein I
MHQNLKIGFTSVLAGVIAGIVAGILTKEPATAVPTAMIITTISCWNQDIKRYIIEYKR